MVDFGVIAESDFPTASSIMETARITVLDIDIVIVASESDFCTDFDIEGSELFTDFDIEGSEFFIGFDIEVSEFFTDFDIARNDFFY